MKSKITVLSKKAHSLVADMAIAAKAHGWSEDQGSANGALKAKKDYESSKLELEQYVLKLEKQIKKYKTGGV